MNHAIKSAARLMASMTLVVTGAVAIPASAQADTPPPTGKAAAQTSDTPALADGPSGNYKCVNTTGARACFAHKGDHVWVKDTKADGHHARASLFNHDLGRPCTGGDCIPPDFSRTCKNLKGAGKWKHCNFNVPENKDAFLAAKRHEGGELLNSKVRAVRT